ncbi:MAG: D-glycero-beta-D-manno-heptose 1-phosphate adenylyltransferase [Pseudonocardia sp.]|nr:D-glycero-beta-D-manno-heptose 1-phosphate adenylyltransferase [Pseudonocardia sp.]MBO0876404.1 D-glycero-beta-D-manno-heptose 1-phosphate adenylyltransferase [Pseudonocardia sp.]
MAVTGPAALANQITSAAPRVLVVGDAILDTWLTGSAHRVGREAPVPVVEVTQRRQLPGGAANTAAALAALGARSRLCALVGNDEEGTELRHELARAGVDTTDVVSGARPTVSKHRVGCADTVLARWDTPPSDRPSDRDTAALVTRLAAALDGDGDPDSDGDGGPPDAVLVCDYDAGGVPDEALAELRRRRDRLPLLVVDAHRPRRWAPARPDLVTPNAAEALALLGAPASGRNARLDRLRAARARLVEACGAGAVVVTLDRDGALLVPSDTDRDVTHVGTEPAPEHRACGAGDVFVAGLTAALACSTDAPSALRLAQAAAEAAIRAAADQPGTARITTEALATRLAPPTAEINSTPLSTDELIAAVTRHRHAGRRVVFTNGCFDVLHRGHVAYLEQARRLGEVLIVALNSDASVARLKGPDRPVNPEADRASVLAALRCVDHVVIFDGDTPVRLLELVRPEIYAKGGDYTPQMLPETPVVHRLGGEVRVLDYLSDHSTSAIMRRIRDRAAS